MPIATALKRSIPKQLPPPNSDFYRLADVLTAEKEVTMPAQTRFDGPQPSAHPTARLTVMNRAFYCRARTHSCAEAALRRLNVAGFAILVLSAAAVVAQCFAAFADEVPTFDLRKTCKADVLAYQGTASGQASNSSCHSSEQEARTTLVSQWTQFSPASKRECVLLQGDAAGPQSYVELLTCLQMASPDQNFK